jgi:hypothetical protein
MLALFCALMLLISSCGGGGGAGGGSAISKGSLRGYVQVPDSANLKIAREASRSAAKGLAGVRVIINTASGAYTTFTDNTGQFGFNALPVGDFTEVIASTGTVLMKMYVPIESAKTTSKNLNAVTTAAAIVYEKLESKNKAPSSIQEVENSNLIKGLITEAETSLINGTYNYDSLKNSQTVSDILDRIEAGASLSDTTPPVVTIITPASGSKVLDSDFVSDKFTVKISYEDEKSVPDSLASPITATLQFGSNAPITIPLTYFGNIPASLTFDIQTTPLNALTSPLIDITSNLTTFTATITVSITDLSNNTGIATSTFTIVPDILNPPE